MKSKPILLLLLPTVTGIILAHYFPLPLSISFIATLALLVLTLAFIKFKDNAFTEILFLLCLLGFGYFRLLHFNFGAPPNHLRNLPRLQNLPLEIVGKLTEEPELKEYYQIFLIETRQVRIGGDTIPVTGKVRGHLPIISRKFKSGDLVQLGGELKQPSGARNPGGFDFSKYLASQSIFTLLSVKDSTCIKLLGHEKGNWLQNEIIQPAQHSIASRLEKLLPPAIANLFKGLILGQRQDISDEFLTSLSFTGTSHILAVSGLHTGFILLILWLIFRILRFPPVLVTALTITGLIFFILLTGARPPVIRAVIMVSVFLIGSQIQRFRDSYNSLAFAALIILLAVPTELFNPGFQLSFGAVFSILYLYPRFTHFLKRTRPGLQLLKTPGVSYLVTLLLVSIAVWVGTLPIVAYYFYIVPVIGILANILVVPLIGVLLALGVVALVISTISLPIALVYGETIQLLSSGLFLFIKNLASFPGSHFFAHRPAIYVFLVYYTLLLLLSQWRHRVRRLALLFLLLLINWRVWNLAFFEEKNLQVIHFDVGQGDATLIRFPNSETMLIDGGDRDQKLDCGEKIISPYLRMQGISCLNYVLVSHPHNDHLGGLLHILRNFEVNQIFFNGDTCDSPIFHEFRTITDSLKIPLQKLKTGDWLRFSDSVDFWVMHPPDSSGIFQNYENNNSIVCKLIYGNSSFLFTGDIEHVAENHLLRFGSLLHSDILKIPHHGSIYSSTLPFLRQVHPAQGIISVGENNRFKHPSPGTLRRLRAGKIRILRTDHSGAIIFESNGIETRQVDWR